MGFLITQATEVSLRFLIHLSLFPPDRIISKTEVVKAQDVSASFLTKISQPLIKRGLVNSKRGKKGGFCLAKRPSEISLLGVLEITEGAPYLNRCLVHCHYCPLDESCPMHKIWQEARATLDQQLSGITLAKVAKQSLESPEYLRLLEERVGAALPFRKPESIT